MQCVNWNVGYFGQQFKLELRLHFAMLYFRTEEHLVRKQVTWQKHPSLGVWKRYLISHRVSHSSDSREGAALICSCREENFCPLKVKRFSLFAMYFMSDVITTWKDSSWMVSLSLYLVLFYVDDAVCVVLGIAKEHPALDRLSN